MIPRPGKKTAAVIAALILLPGLLYAPAGDGPFLFDDETGVLELTAGHADQSLGQVLRFWEKGPLAYRPLRFLSFAADWKLGGGDPTVFHITNIILHGLCCLLLLGLFRRFRMPASIAFTAALLFCVHPIQTEAVAYISGRKDLLCALFYLIALHSSLSAGRSPRHASRLAWSVIFFAAGLLSYLSKEMALSLPLAALMLDMIDRGSDRLDVGSAFPRRVFAALRGRPVFYALMICGGAVGLIEKLVLSPGTRVPIGSWSEPLRNIPLLLQTVSLHVRKIIWPWPHAADMRGLFPDRLPDTITGTIPAAGWSGFWNGGGLVATIAGLILLGLSVTACRRAAIRVRTAATAGLCFFLIALIPVSNLVRLNEPAAEHYLYLPMAGGALLMAALIYGLADRSDRGRRRSVAASVATTALILLLATMTFVRAGAWSSETRLWSSAAAANPTGARALNNLGLALGEAGDAGAAAECFVRALRFEPGSVRTTANLAGLLRKQADFDGALRTVDAALALRPDDPLLLSMKGGILLASGRAAEALRPLDRVAELQGGPEAAGDEWARDRGVAHFQAGDASEAALILETAAADAPGNPSLWTNLGVILLSLNRIDDAADALENAVALPGSPPSAQRNLAVARLRQGRPDEARLHLETARRMGDAIPEGLEKAVAAAESTAAGFMEEIR